MAFIYNVYERDNKIPNAKSPRVAVATNRQIRQISTKELAEDIADRCTVHRADVQAVLDALSISATSYLLNGFGVKLGELGSFSMRINCKSAPTMEEFTPDLIKGAKVRYTPSRDILARIKETGFVRGSNLSNGKVVAPAPKPGATEDTPKDPNEGSTGTPQTEGDTGY
ncbi:hypothetical protein HMPREF3027_03580 [Porphyromonas sp. HMSC077F02]|uniref:HU family DNA-binding protein n=1 Tax=Porphyromonas sp. HMSC077F02 TaxID=1739529 RepID=UPI0008A41FD8|nr:HU family DNA-binding protein [Porphyromonas sp. HMSC077F02]OFO55252.1 hypothetical protein HMPREF3027_03580 [Porphyromonas sp. HMSC077F02]